MTAVESDDIISLICTHSVSASSVCDMVLEGKSPIRRNLPVTYPAPITLLTTEYRHIFSNKIKPCVLST